MAKIRVLRILALTFGLLCLISIVPQNHLPLNYANAQQNPSAPNFVQIGFSPSTLSNLQEGTPVYVPLDQMWIGSNYSRMFIVSLAAPNGSIVVHADVFPLTVVMLHQFLMQDQEGTWSLQISLQNGTSYQLPLVLVHPELHKVEVNLSAYGFQNGNLNIQFGLGKGDAYDIEGCLVQSTQQSLVNISVPSAIGTGQISIDWNGQQSNLSFTGRTAQPFSFWYEMDYPYSYTSSNPNQIVSRQVSVGSADPVILSSEGQTNTIFAAFASMRPGRYDLRGFFESSAGAYMTEASVLVLNAYHWYAIGSCNPSTVSPPEFSMQDQLSGSAPEWPNSLLLAFRVDGVDSFETFPLGIEAARVDFVSSSFSVPLNGLSYDLEQNPDVLLSNVYNGSMYVIGKQFPLVASVQINFGNSTYDVQQVILNRPYRVYTLDIQVGKLAVQGSLDGVQITGATVEVADSRNGVVRQSTDGSGGTTFYLPPGAYTLKFSWGQFVESRNVTISPGDSLLVQVSFSTPQDYSVYILGIAALIGTPICVYIWVVWIRRRKYVFETKA